MFDIRKLQEEALYHSIKTTESESSATEIVYGANNEHTSESNEEWVKNTMTRLENTYDSHKIKEIRMHCQCGYGMDEKIALVQKLVQQSSTWEEFANHDEAIQAGLSYKENILYLEFHFCPCPMLTTVKKLDSYSWCQCTTGYSKVLFEKALGCEVDVTLLKSIKAGDDICRMKIIPKEGIFQ